MTTAIDTRVFLSARLLMAGGFVLLAGTTGFGLKPATPALRLKADPLR